MRGVLLLAGLAVLGAAPPSPVVLLPFKMLDKGYGISRLATCNTIPHASNAIDLAPAIAAEVADLLPGPD